MIKSSRESLNRLKSLVGELNDRDSKLKQDMQLFEDFFENFPIPVTMWSVTREGSVISQRGNGLICEHATDLKSMFECPVLQEMSLEAHEEAFQGTSVQQFASKEEKMYYVSIVPRKSKSGDVAGVSGIAWDITSNAVMLSTLEDIQELAENKSGSFKKIHKLASKALAASRLRALMNDDSGDVEDA